MLYYHEGTDDYYCDDCYPDDDNIHDYSYKPDPIFYGNDNIYIGVELEIDKGDDRNVVADYIAENIPEIYCKCDGSLNCGVELVSHPSTLDYHLCCLEWDKVFDIARSEHFKSHDAKTCGLHCHINRSAFGECFEEQENNISKVVYLVEKFFNVFTILSRRGENELERWASRYNVNTGEGVKKAYSDAKGKMCGRYVAVNLCNKNTIEFRLWRGTLKASTFFATLELTHYICNVAINNSDETIEKMSFEQFYNNIPDTYTYIKDYINSKNIFVGGRA
jgi:hypothetical protein